MNNNIVKEISDSLSIKIEQAKEVLRLLKEGNTIPFIARYRKEATGNLDEETIRKITSVYEYQINLFKRKEDVIRLIEEKDLMTNELKAKIVKAEKLVEVEDLYRPFKEKKKTKATEAIKEGLEPLAKIIMSFPMSGNINEIANKFVTDKILTIEYALTGAKYIIAEWISDNANYRKWIRKYIYKTGLIVSKIKKNSKDENKNYEMYYDYKEAIKSIKSYRIMAINRGESENVINVGIEVSSEEIINYLENKIVKNSNSFVIPLVIDAIKDSYKRLIFPSIEREIRKELTEIGEVTATEVFGKNVEKLLLTPPMKEKVVLGFDPAFRTGCKLAVLDNVGNVLDISVIYPHEPKNEIEISKKHIKYLINKFDIDIIAIGNGTASRESEKFISDTIKEISKKVKYVIISEAGASIYSASKLAIEEFPNLDVQMRSAISIGRRLQDPLSELVKIDPKSIGVGEYQHDVAHKKLDQSLNFIVSKAVNSVGVNVNTASMSLLKYVSGMSQKAIDGLLKYREKNGKINSREELKNVDGFSNKIFEQSIGFMRIIDGNNVLDKTSIHPESYDLTLKLLKLLNFTLEDLGTNSLKDILGKLNILYYVDILKVDKYTLEDIIKSLKQPNRDPREDMPIPLLRDDILTLEDLKIGMKLQGIVRNVVSFGAFIDIGLKNDGLVHISKLSNHYINHPLEVINVGDIVDCYVDDILFDKKKVSLSLLNFQK